MGISAFTWVNYEARGIPAQVERLRRGTPGEIRKRKLPACRKREVGFCNMNETRLTQHTREDLPLGQRVLAGDESRGKWLAGC